MEDKLKTSLLPGPTVVVVDEVEGPVNAKSAPGWRVSPCVMVMGIMLVLAASVCGGAALMVGISNAESKAHPDKASPESPLSPPVAMYGRVDDEHGNKDDEGKNVDDRTNRLDLDEENDQSDLYYDMKDTDNLYYDLYYDEDEVKKMLAETYEYDVQEVEGKEFNAEKYDHSEKKEYDDEKALEDGDEKEFTGPQEINMENDFAKVIAKVKGQKRGKYTEGDFYDASKLAALLGDTFTACVKNRLREFESYFDEDVDEQTMATFHKKAIADCAEDNESKMKSTEIEASMTANKVYYKETQMPGEKDIDADGNEMITINENEEREQGKDHQILSEMLYQCMETVASDADMEQMAAITEKLRVMTFQEEAGFDMDDLMDTLEPCARGIPGPDVVGKLMSFLEGTFASYQS